MCACVCGAIWTVVYLVFFRAQRNHSPVCLLESSRPLLAQASWSSAACCCSSVGSGCWAPSSGFTDPPANSRTDIRLQRTMRPGERPALQSRRTGGLTATLREEWWSPESCARPGTAASFPPRPIPPRQAEGSPGVSTPQISPPIHWCGWTTRRWESEVNWWGRWRPTILQTSSPSTSSCAMRLRRGYESGWVLGSAVVTVEYEKHQWFFFFLSVQLNIVMQPSC